MGLLADELVRIMYFVDIAVKGLKQNNTVAKFKREGKYMTEEIMMDCKSKSLDMIKQFIENHTTKCARFEQDFISFGDTNPITGRLYYSAKQCGFMGMWVLVYLILSLGGRGQRPKFYIDLKAIQFRRYYAANPRDDRLETFENLGEVEDAEKVILARIESV